MKRLIALELGGTFTRSFYIEVANFQSIEDITTLGCILKFLQPLKKLNYLNLSYSSMQHESISNLTNFKELRYLIANTSNLSTDQLNTVYNNLLNLQHLELTFSFVYDEGVENIGKLSGLTYLNINGNFLRNKGLQSICNCKELKHLLLGANELSDGDHKKDFSKLKKLQVLDLSRNRAFDQDKENRIGDKILQSVIMLESLTYLDISHCGSTFNINFEKPAFLKTFKA